MTPATLAAIALAHEVFGEPQAQYEGLPWWDKVRRIGGMCDKCDCDNTINPFLIPGGDARRLALLAQLTAESETGQQFFHVSEFAKDGGSGNWSKFIHRGFVVESENDDPTKKQSGMYHITDRGVAFILGEIRIPKYIVLKWKNELIGYGGPLIDFTECLNNKFDYSKLMGWAKE